MTKQRDPNRIRADLLEAAIASYTTGGSFSVREIAKRAGVNHGQIHHLFGGKEGLERAMFEHLGEQMLKRFLAAAPGESGELLSLMKITSLSSLVPIITRVLVTDGERFARALGRFLVEGASPVIAQQRFPVVEAMLAFIESRPAEERPELRILLAEGLARALGWLLFSPWIIKAARLDEEQIKQVEERIGSNTRLEELWEGGE